MATSLYACDVIDLDYALIDVFTNVALAGNQLAVFFETNDIEEHLLQKLALEMNLSETVFVSASNSDTAKVRYFTTIEELDFAGHPTLGTAILLAERLNLNDKCQVKLQTNKGTVAVELEKKNELWTGWMEQPIPTISHWDKSTELLEILGFKQSILPIEAYDNGISHLFVMLKTPDNVLSIKPDYPALGTICKETRINVFGQTNTGYVSRMFSPFDPAMPEDPACGSAAGPLTAHLLRHRHINSGDMITISQGEKINRPSTLYAKVTGTPNKLETITVGGSAITIGHGKIQLNTTPTPT